MTDTDLDLERSMTEQLPIERTIFKTDRGLVCTPRVQGKDREFINDKGQKMNGDCASFRGGILKLWWNGKWWEVPSMAEFQEWTMDSVCPTPDGEMVEPDHEDSWLSLAGLV